MQPLNDNDLERILRKWTVPSAPASLESRLRASGSLRWWQWFLWGSIRVPVPVGALALAALATLSVLAFQGLPRTASNSVPDTSDFQLVDDLNPRIIRSSYESN